MTRSLFILSVKLVKIQNILDTETGESYEKYI